MFELPKVPQIKSAQEYAFDALASEVIKFECSLDNEHEVGFCLVGSGAGTVFHADTIQQIGGGLLKFGGTNSDGEKVVLVSHFTQMNVLFTSVRKRADNPIRIGFIHHKDG